MIRREEDCALQRRKTNIAPGQDIVLTGFVALKGTAALAKASEDLLRKHLPGDFVDSAQNLTRFGAEAPSETLCDAHGVSALYPVEDGITAALWHFCAATGCGITVRLRDFPIRQETVEVCEITKTNPYQIAGGGCMLICAEQGYRLVNALKEAGVPAAVVGSVRADAGKWIINGETVSALNRP